MSKQIATRVFCSYIGYNGIGKEKSYGDGEMQGEDLGNIRELCLKSAKEYNRDVKSIHLLAVTPLEFETVVLKYESEDS